MKMSRVALLAGLDSAGSRNFCRCTLSRIRSGFRRQTAEAARLNNIGVAYMNQQLFEKALKQFERGQRAGSQVADGADQPRRSFAQFAEGRRR